MTQTRPSFFLAILAAMALAASARGQEAVNRTPHIGYAYPAGGQQGTTVRVTVGGQFLREASGAYLTGGGVSARVIRSYPPLRNIQREQRMELMERLQTLRDRRIAELRGLAPPREAAPPPGEWEMAAPGSPAPGERKPAAAPKEAGAQNEKGERPLEHPLLEELDSKSLRELAHVAHTLFFPREMRQPNAQLEEMALVEITIAPGAAPGGRELRLQTASGLTNPVVFQIGSLPEVHELEPNDPGADPRLPAPLPPPPPLALPALLNGQIYPGDVDRFRIEAKKGQRLVAIAQARRLNPYLADAVPGWFQAVISLYNPEGREIAFNDDFRFEPDPVVLLEIPEDGVYELEIRDSIYRGREDFVYRIAVGELPFITGMFPLGGQEGAETAAWITGWNLATDRLALDTRPGAVPGAAEIRYAALREGEWITNALPYAVDSLPESHEVEPNDSPGQAQEIATPRVLNGFIAQPGDVDYFRFEGREGEEITAEILARRLDSPMDSLLRILDSSGRVLAWNDDFEDKAMGLLTHHADSRASARLPRDGAYFAQVSEAQRHGGPVYGYRLRLSPPRPDFALRVTPSSLSAPPGRSAVITAHALRKDGFDGPIEVALRNPPAGFSLEGARIPAGCDRIRMTLTTPRKPLAAPVAIQLAGFAQIGGRTVERPAIPAEDRMQAFAYMSLVPSQALVVANPGARRAWAPVELVRGGGAPLRLAPGGCAEVRVKAPRRPILSEVSLELSDPPPGLSIEDVNVVADGLAFTLRAASEAKAPLSDNLIVEAFASLQLPRPDGTQTEKKRRVSLGALPAIPIEITRR